MLTGLLAGLALTMALPFANATPPHPTSNLQPPNSRPQSPTSDLAGKIDPALRKRLLTADPHEAIPIVVEMRERADLSAALAEPDQAARLASVVNALQTAAERSQAGVRAVLAAMEIEGRASDVRPYWIFNGLAARLAAEDVAALAARDDVALVREDAYRQWITEAPGQTSTYPARQEPSVEWGIRAIRADEVWAALNISGTGVVVANMDTGVDWQHPALQTAYRGYAKGIASHAGNWLDATGGGAAYPIDPHSHGTHTLGTIVGAGGIGVAPGAKWMAVRVLDAAGYGFDSWIHAGFEWVLAPGGDPSLAPDVLSNSWGSTFGSSTAFQDDLRALRAAGIFAVFSAGNAGPAEGSVGSPASLPEAFAVGAIDDEDLVAAFSSRGPSPWGEVRPHVAAPGVDVRSSVPGGGYASYHGTSMAAPHVAGIIALMLSANPSMTITSPARLPTETAVPLSTTIPNNASGYGRVDAYAAVQTVASLGTLSGAVTRSDNGAPVAGAAISAASRIGTFGAATSAADGRYTRGLAATAYTVTASAFGYVTATRTSGFIITGTTTTANFALAPLPTGVLRGTLTDAESGQPLSGTIVVARTPVTRAAAGAYSLTLPGGVFEVRAIASGHRVVTASVAITPGQTVSRDFALPPSPSILLVDSGPWYSGSQIAYYRAALDELNYIYDEWRVRDLLTDVPISTTLTPYDIVIWSAPQDSPGLIGAGGAISAYLSSGGSLFVSGQDVGFWDGGLSSSWSSYYYDRLKALALLDDSGSRALTGTGIFSGLAVSITGAGGADNQLYPDAIGSADPDVTASAFTYDNGQLGAQTTGLCLPYRAVYLGFGYEAVRNASGRREVMARALAYFDSPRNAAGMTLTAGDELLISPAGRTVTTALRLRNIADAGVNDTFLLTAASSGWSVSLDAASAALAACADRTLVVTVTVPAGTPIDTAQSVTITARSSVSPALVVSDTFIVKTPALALLVDDDRWYDVEDAYEDALAASGISFDRWDVRKNWAGVEPSAPSAERLGWYRFAVWFTGYDWYQPLTVSNEDALAQYLNAGGRVLLSSQSHLGWSGLDDFNRARLGILDADYVTTTQARAVPGSPFDGLSAMPLEYPFPNYSESPAPYPTATVALVGSHGRPIALGHAGQAGRALFMSFPFEAIPEANRADVMAGAIGYLSWLGGASVTADKTVAAPGSTVLIRIVIRNDGPTLLSSAAFSVTLPPGVLAQSGGLSWSGSLAAGQAVTTTFSVVLGAGLPSGGFVSLPVTFVEAEHGLTFRRQVRIGINRPDLSAGRLTVSRSPAQSSEIVTWTIAARNTGLASAPSAVVTGTLPVNATWISGTLAASSGVVTGVTSDTVQWTGSIPTNGAITITYRMTVPAWLADRLLFGSALFDDGATLTTSNAWLAARPYRAYLPVIRKLSP